MYRTSSRPSAHDNSLTEKYSLLTSHNLAPKTRCQSLAPLSHNPTPHHLNVTR